MNARSLRRYLPPQHGAWAMLLLPYLAGVLTAGFRWLDLPLLGAWLGGYLLSYFALQAVKTRRAGRFRRQLLWYGSITVACAVPVVVGCPRVLIFAPAYGGLLAVNVWYAVRRRERALVNDLASVVQSCLMVFVVGAVAGVTPVAPFVVVLLYLTGVVLYVKTMIRERESSWYRRASIAFHAGAVVVAGLVGVVAVIVFGVLLVRAWGLAGRRIPPRRVGVIEIVASSLVLVAAVV